MNQKQIENTVNSITDKLMTNCKGDVAYRLCLKSAGERELGGLNRAAVKRVLREELAKKIAEEMRRA